MPYKKISLKALRIIIFSILFKSNGLAMKIRMKVAKWRKSKGSESPTSAWVSIKELENKQTSVMTALSYMKSTEANLEATIQLIVLICFHFIPFLLPKVSGLGPEFEPTQRSTWVLMLLIVSPIVTFISNIVATVTAIDITKGSQLGFKATCLLGMYLLLQLSSHAFRIIPTVLASLPCIDTTHCFPKRSASLTSLQASLLIIVPFFTSAFVNMILISDRIKALPDKIFHLIRKAVSNLTKFDHNLTYIIGKWFRVEGCLRFNFQSFVY